MVGGFRYVELEESCSIQYLKWKSTDLFFPNSKKCYGEHSETCLITLTDAANRRDTLIKILSSRITTNF